jgi:Tol biopolymer transport system component
MTLSVGSRLGPYHVTAQIGAGGMGTVYRATDTTLERSVAVKVLPDSFAADPERLARFEREAKTLASLNHPHIAQIYGFEKAGGTPALIMELVEGPTLADRIAAAPMVVDEALVIARQIAEALEAAHDHGIIHRDLKPANVKVRDDGTVKVLDFGLAKALEPAISASGVTLSPTITSPAMTHAGVILGTAAYMSPEQARGRPVDRRADIWAFGCVLFEMLAGRRPFPEEETVSDTLAGVLKGEPAWTALPADTPPPVRALVERCLRKDVRRRLSHIAEARIAIEETDGVSAPPSQPNASWRGRFLWPAIASVAVVVAAAAGIRLLRVPTLESVPALFKVYPPAGALPLIGVSTPREIDIGEPISPDGRVVAFMSTYEGRSTVWIRRLDSDAAHPLVSTKGAGRPVWSPDSQSLAFPADGQLKRVALAGGPATTIMKTDARDFAWGPANVILIGGQRAGLLRVSPDGGEAVPATTLDAGETSHDYPHFLPDGRHFLYMARRGGTPADWDVYVGSLDSNDRRLLRGIHAAVRYSPSGHLLFERDGALTAVPFNPERLELGGAPFAVIQELSPGPRATYSVSSNGTLAYLTDPPAPQSQLAWFDRNGTQNATFGPALRYEHLRLSRNGQTVVFDRAVDRQRDVLSFDVTSGRTSPLVSSIGADFSAVFSPTGDRVAFASSREPATNAGIQNLDAGQLYVKVLGAAGDGEVIFKSDAGKKVTDWSRDGRYLAFTSRDDVWALPMSLSSQSDNAPIQVTKTANAESGGMFSPDSQWIAYQSNESAGAMDVYVKAFPDGARYPVSVGGGSAPRWGSDGRTLFYVSPDGALMSVAVTRTANALSIGKPVALFDSHALRGAADYDVLDNDRFLLKVPLADQEDISVAVIVNWAATMKGRRR